MCSRTVCPSIFDDNVQNSGGCFFYHDQDFFSCASLITFCQHCTSGVESGWGRAQALDGSFVKILFFIKCQSVLYLSVKFRVDRPENLSHCVIIVEGLSPLQQSPLSFAVIIDCSGLRSSHMR